MPTEEQVLGAIKAVCAAAVAPRPVHTLGEVDRLPEKPDNYVEVSLSRRFGTSARLDPGPDITYWRVVVQAVGVLEENPRTMPTQVRGALDGAQVAVGSGSTSPVAHEVSRAVGPDDDWWSGMDTWIFTT